MCARVCVCVWAYVWWEEDTAGIGHFGWGSFWKLFSSLDTHKHLHAAMSTHAQRQTVLGHLGVFVSLGVTVKQSPAGVAAGHWQLNKPHVCLHTVWAHTPMDTQTHAVILASTNSVLPSPSFAILCSLVTAEFTFYQFQCFELLISVKDLASSH